MKITGKIKLGALAFAAMIVIMSFSALAATPKEMIENGQVSDGPIVYGDVRDGEVSDISTDMENIGDEISEFAETVISDVGDIVSNPVDEIKDVVNGTSDKVGTAGVLFGIVVAVLAAIAVIALIFYLTKRG